MHACIREVQLFAFRTQPAQCLSLIDALQVTCPLPCAPPSSTAKPGAFGEDCLRAASPSSAAARLGEPRREARRAGARGVFFFHRFLLDKQKKSVRLSAETDGFNPIKKPRFPRLPPLTPSLSRKGRGIKNLDGHLPICVPFSSIKKGKQTSLPQWQRPL
jgi:hypothetical protein